MPEIYAMIASALEIWVLRSEYKVINFIVRGSFRCISSQFSSLRADVSYFLCFCAQATNSEDPNTKNIPGEHAPVPPKRFGQDLVLAPRFWLLQYLVFCTPLAFQELFPASLHHKHRHIIY